MFDTHAHIHDTAYDGDREAMLERASAAGVARIMTIGTDLTQSVRAYDTARRYGLDYTIGIHPHEAKDAPEDVGAALDAILRSAATPPRAIGEMGFDFYYNHSSKEAQRRVFLQQLRYARERGLPAVFHLRDAFDEFFEVLGEEAGGKLRGVVHCFTGNTVQARTIVERFDLVLGIGGVVTFKTAQDVRDAVLAVGLDRIVLETDCPYLAPVPHRGKRNEPAFLADTAGAVAALFGTTPEEVRRRTDETASALLGPPA